ncbi:MAG: 4-alpha-glucanotransferase, partial [Thermoplasmata archaeon]
MLRTERARRAEQRLEPVTVAWVPARSPPLLSIATDPVGTAHARVHVAPERGVRRTYTVNLHRNPRANAGRSWIELPRRWPVGYHTIGVRGDRWSGRTRLFVAPRRLPGPPRRSWGLFAPTYALHDERSWGVGDLRTLGRFVEWAARQGARTVGSLPLLATHLGGKIDPSPYRPTSRAFWNELCVDPTSPREYRESREVQHRVRSPAFRRELVRLRERSHIDPTATLRAKRAILEGMFRRFGSTPSRRRTRFRNALRRDPLLRAFARYRAAESPRGRPRGGSWQYHAYVQWLVTEQLDRLSRRSRHLGVSLYLDLPVGVHPQGFD